MYLVAQTGIDWVAIAGLAIALLGIPITYFLARRTRQKPVVRYAIDHEVLIDPDSNLREDGFSLRYRSAEIPRLSRTYIALWHERGDAVEHKQIVPDDPLRVELAEGGLALQFKLLYRSRRATGLTCSPDTQKRNSARIAFTFLDEGDGGLMELLHQGEDRPSIAGTIVGARLRRSSARVKLSPKRLEWMREKSSRKRFARRFRSVSRRKRILFLQYVFTLLALVATIVVPMGIELWRQPKIVDTSQFDLTSLEGQFDFANKVRSIGLPDTPSAWVWILMGALIVILSIVAFSGMLGKVTIPRTILKEEAKEGAAHEGAKENELPE